MLVMIIVAIFLLIGIGILLFNPLRVSQNPDDSRVSMIPFAVYCLVCALALFRYADFLTQKNLKIKSPEIQKNISKVVSEVTSEPETGNKILFDKSKNGPIPIRVNDPTEYDFKTKAEIYALRKSYANQVKEFIDGEYQPNEDVLHVVDGRPWWGMEGILCKGQGDVSITGLSRESNYGNNPFVLMDISLSRLMGDERKKPNCEDSWPKLTSLAIYPNKKTIVAKYDISSFLEERKGSDFERSLKNNDWFLFGNINARDFGYQAAMQVDGANIRYAHETNPVNKVQRFNNYWCLGHSCKYEGGCNNICPSNDPYAFYIDGLPAYAKFALFKNADRTFNADAYMEIYMY